MNPDYACAVIADPRGWLLLELRPAEARHAGGRLTCFGGRREVGEDAAACLRRELNEELAWHPAALAPGCDLIVGGAWIARFFRCAHPGGSVRARCPGHAALWAPWPSLPGLPLSPWHRAALSALAEGRTRVALPA